MEKDLLQPVGLGTDPQLLLSWLYSLHFLHVVLYLPYPRQRADCHPGRTLGLNPVYRNDTHGTAWGMAVRQSGSALWPTPWTQEHGLDRHDCFDTYASSGWPRGRRHLSHLAA